MEKNLDVLTYRNGDIIPQVTDPTAWKELTTGAWCYYNNDVANGAIYGKLYNWYAVNDPKGLAPTGWHIPSDAEWAAVSTTLGGDEVSGGKMKEAGTPHWATPNTAGNNNSGFAGLPGGYCTMDGVFIIIGTYGGWWSSTVAGTTAAWFRGLWYGDGQLRKSSSGNPAGFYVRCLRD
jgi:uncharacterized protein (TIGR02145 family)